MSSGTVLFTGFLPFTSAFQAEIFQQEENQMNNKKILAFAIALVVVIGAFIGIWAILRDKPQEGTKAITIEVVDDKAATKSYSLKTDAEYLREAMDEAKSKGFTYEGTESEYGLMISHVNGLRADYTQDGAYWAIYVNGEYGQYGADAQPVADGDTYKFEYTPAN